MNNAITISENEIRTIARQEVARMLLRLEPIVREEIYNACQLVSEDRGIELLAIKGADPKRTFRRLMNKHRVEKVKLGGATGWKLTSVEALIKRNTVNGSNNFIDVDTNSAGRVSARMNQLRGTQE